MNEAVQADASPQPYESSHYASLVLNLGRALLHVGSPAHRLESAMQIMANRLGLQAEFFSTPTSLIVSLGDGEKQKTFLARSDPGTANLSKLADLTAIMDQLEQGTIDPEQADARVRAIDSSPPRYGTRLELLGFTGIAIGVAPLIGGGWRETLLATLLGTVCGGCVLWLRRHVDRARLTTPLTAALITFLGTLWCGFDPQTALMPAIIASMIALVPGMDLTTACRELATGHVVSGASRMAFALMIFALLTFGLVMGGMAGQLVVGPVDLISPSARPDWLPPLAILVAAFGLMLLFQAHRRDWIWMLGACLLAWAGASLGAWLGAPVMGAFIGALIVGLAGNLFVKFTGRPGSIIHLPGLILLVPGSIGLRSLATLLGDDILSGIETAMLAGMIAVALTTGMILASVLLPPRNAL
ncbi:MAG: threonine/serine exporter family protein [Wenzhouxiangella sp.]|nr:MAG: threonine/serine exporter family protein [Wenzhouxiangella sp.]